VLSLSTFSNKTPDHDRALCLPALSLAGARGLRSDYLALLADGINPQIQAEVAEEQQQIAPDNIFQRSPLTGSSSKAKALLQITQKTFGAH